MSYIRAHQVNVGHEPVGKTATIPDGDDAVHLEVPQDFAHLDFASRILAMIDALPEGEAIIIWKEIF